MCSMCQFPFLYAGQLFTDCTEYNEGYSWCSIGNTEGGGMENWEYCGSDKLGWNGITCSGEPGISTRHVHG